MDYMIQNTHPHRPGNAWKGNIRHAAFVGWVSPQGRNTTHRMQGVSVHVGLRDEAANPTYKNLGSGA